MSEPRFYHPWRPTEVVIPACVPDVIAVEASRLFRQPTGKMLWLSQQVTEAAIRKASNETRAYHHGTESND